MVFVNEGIEDIQLRAIRGTNGNSPTHLIFAGSDNTFLGTEEELVNEFIDKEITWYKEGVNSKWRVQLASTEAIGSNIQAIGIVTGESTSTDTLYVISPSFIGNKDNTFNVQSEGEVIIRRPNA